MQANIFESLLLNGEEVLTFEGTVFWQICAVDSVADSIDSKPCPQCVRSQILGNLWIHGSNQIS